ncbi:alpha/beta fold hydrolase [Yinghuangia soli]|uniref:Alpha/beta hydrolase n=1 Tax=Yinghuangia soli TaxID=2908204 RepID=A0AA41PXX5_9ACTN|nr:alpha/beta hydrolase [Yinghuangia soli]MCF2527726.1 alpha/beta hydrolase [Yinghuangia soli]
MSVRAADTRSPRPSEPAAFASAYDVLLARWSCEVEQFDLVTPHGTTHVNACGPVGAPPLVLLHGGGTTAAVWYANAAELAREHRVYAIDRIGEPGRSTRGDAPPRDVAGLHGWLDAVLDALGLDRADLCGHSYGAWIALTYALYAPERVSRLVLLDPTQCFGGFRPGYLLRALPSLLRPSAARARAFLAWETAGASAEAAPEWLELYGLAAEFPEVKVVVGRRPKVGDLQALDVPTKIVLAGRSRTHDARKIAASAARAMPGAETAVLEDVSHHGMPYHHAPELNAQISEFLARG